MKFPIFLYFLFLMALSYPQFVFGEGDQQPKESPPDTNQVINLNKLGYNNRLVDAKQTIIYAERALLISTQLNYINGIAEAYRIKGIGKYYSNQNDSAIANYLHALNYFKQSKSLEGEAKVYNNIGNLYRDVDYDKALEYLDRSLKIADKLHNQELIASLYGNMGNIHQKKKKYTLALLAYQKSNALFDKLGNLTGLTQGLQNIGVAYYNLHELDKSEQYLLQAIKNAKENDLNGIVAASNLTLSSVYIASSRFVEAEKSINEGISYSKIVNDPKLQYDYLITSYELEDKRKNYPKALQYLKQVYKQDSLSYKNNESVKIDLLQEQSRQREKQIESDKTILQQKYTKTLFWASTIVAGLAFVVILLLINSVKRSAKTNKQLKRLNLEVSKQKEDLDKVNHNLEGIIEDRTKDLIIKNKKLSEYSSHLSHQIRGPIATLKGLILLEKDHLIEKDELMHQIQTCVYDIDDKIVNINETLNSENKESLFKEE